MSWFQIWTICWQVAVFLTPVVLAACIMWLRSQFVSKGELANQVTRIEAKADTDRASISSDIKRLDATVNDHHSRLRMAEADMARPPSRHTLNNAISTMQGGLMAVERGVDDMRRQMETQSADLRRQMETLNGYLHTVIEKHLG